MPAFQHRHASHCESGVMAALVTHAGLPMSEPMAFGLASALAFAFIPIIKVGGQPLVAFRIIPRAIIRRLHSLLGLSLIAQILSIGIALTAAGTLYAWLALRMRIPEARQIESLILGRLRLRGRVAA